MLTIGIDIGTTSICIVLYDSLTNEIIKKAVNKNSFLTGAHNYEQDPDEIINKVLKSIEGISINGVSSIGISSQMHGMLYVDEVGNAISPLYTWKDQKANQEHTPGITYEEVLQNATKYPIYSGYATATHYYLMDQKLVPKKAYKLVSIGDYLAIKLTGNITPCMDPSIAASFGGYSIEDNQMDQNLMEKLDIDPTIYPKIVPTGTVAGFYKKAKVLWAYGDNQASFLGAVGRRKDCISVNVGTGSQVSVMGPALFGDYDVEVRPFLANSYLYVGASLNGGKAYERLAAFIEEICSLGTGIKVDAYDLMPSLVKEVEETDLVTCPSLYGDRGGKVTGGTIAGLTSENFHISHVIRSYVHGMAKELYQLYARIPEEIRLGKTAIVASGNGIRKNTILQKEIASVFKLPVTFSTHEEEAAAGVAMLCSWI